MLMYESARPKKNKVDLVTVIKDKILQIIKIKISRVNKRKKETVKQENTSIEYLEIPKTRDIVINQFKLFTCFNNEPEQVQEVEETKDNYTLFKEYIKKNSNDGVLPGNKDIESDLNISDSTIKRMKNKAVESGFIEKISDRKYILKIQ